MYRLTSPVVDLGHAVDHVVHEGAVVGDHDDGAGVAAQKALEPLHRFQDPGGSSARRARAPRDCGSAASPARCASANRRRTRWWSGVMSRSVKPRPNSTLRTFDSRRVAAEHLVGVPRPAHGRQLRFGGVRRPAPPPACAGAARLPSTSVCDEMTSSKMGRSAHLDGLLLQIAHARALGEEHAALVRIVLAADDDVEHVSSCRRRWGPRAPAGRTLPSVNVTSWNSVRPP